MDIPDDIREFFRKAGQRGGAKKSKAKHDAILANLDKARKALKDKRDRELIVIPEEDME